MKLNNLFAVFILLIVMAGVPVVQAGQKEEDEFAEEAARLQNPPDQMEDADFYSRMAEEGDSLQKFNDLIQQAHDAEDAAKAAKKAKE
jgi:hypothetical protein